MNNYRFWILMTRCRDTRLNLNDHVRVIGAHHGPHDSAL